MICPNCKKSNRCNCPSCNPNNIQHGTVIVLPDSYKCFWCGFEFSPDESLDAEWEIMIDDIKIKISKDYVTNWILNGNNPDEFGDFELKMSSIAHLKVNTNYPISKETLNGLRRGQKIDKII